MNGLKSRVPWCKSVLVVIYSIILTGSVAAQVQFTEVGVASGVGSDFYRTNSGHALGINWIDFNNDGWDDLFMINGLGEASHLYHNNGNGTFTNVDSLLPDLTNREKTGSIFADYDNDGDSDIYIFQDNATFSLFGDNPQDGPPNILLKNLWMENGEQFTLGVPLFEDVTGFAGVENLAEVPLGSLPGLRSYTGGWFDSDRDGWVDLYVGQMVLQVTGEVANKNQFYRNLQNGTFEDQSVASGLGAGTDTLRIRPTLAFIGAHFDSDLWPDAYVVNVHEASPFHHDILFQNDGTGNYSDITGLSPGLGDDSGSGMGIDLADIDLNGTWDFYISDIANTFNDASKGNPLHLGNGDGTFADNIASQAGVKGTDSWGVNFFDADHDGLEDLFVATLGQKRDLFYINNGGASFTNFTTQAGITEIASSRGSAVSDYDCDGDMDLAVITQAGFLRLYRNDTINPGNWLQIKLKGTSSNRDAIGALVHAQVGSVTRMRQIKGGSSAHSEDSLRVHFGVGDATMVDEIRIFWPSALVETLSNIPTNRQLTVVEGSIQGATDPNDLDGDGLPNALDNCPLVFNPDQTDTDGDGIGDVCDKLTSADSDGDGVPDAVDNCPTMPNPDRLDADHDGQGDVCDPETTFPLNIVIVSPNEVVRGATDQITILGTGFEEGTSIRLCRNGRIFVDLLQFVDSNMLLVDVTVPANSQTGPCSLRLMNPDGETDLLLGGFSIVSGGGGGDPSTVDLLSVIPNELPQGSTQQLTFIGTGFQDGAMVILCGNNRVIIDAVQFIDSENLLVDVTIPANSSTGNCAGRVTNPDGASDLLLGAISIVASASGGGGGGTDPLEVLSVSPNLLTLGTAAQLTVSGTGFLDGAIVGICRNSGIIIDLVTFLDAQTLLVDVTLPGSVSSNACPLSVTNPNGDRDILFSAVSFQ